MGETSETLATFTCTDIVLEFRRALLALRPTALRLDLIAADGSEGDDFDRLAETLWDVCVARSLQWKYGLDDAPALPRYGFSHFDFVPTSSDDSRHLGVAHGRAPGTFVLQRVRPAAPSESSPGGFIAVRSRATSGRFVRFVDYSPFGPEPLNAALVEVGPDRTDFLAVDDDLTFDWTGRPDAP